MFNPFSSVELINNCTEARRVEVSNYSKACGGEDSDYSEARMVELTNTRRAMAEPVQRCESVRGTIERSSETPKTKMGNNSKKVLSTDPCT
jgi:hypothetical protein